MADVWNLDLAPTEKLVLLAFADHADDQGYCYPSSDRIAHKSNISARHAKRVIGSLIDSGLLDVVDPGGGRGNPRRVVVRPGKGDKLSPYQAERVTPTSPNTPETSPQKGDTVSLNDVDNSPERVTSDAERVTPTSPESSVEPSGTTTTDSSLRSESAEVASREITTSVLLGAWIDLQPIRPAEPDIKKQGAFAKRICAKYGDNDIRAACAGIWKVFPYCDGEPWDLGDLEKKFMKAVSKAMGNGSNPKHAWLNDMFSNLEES
jgi:hypothetical protein